MPEFNAVKILSIILYLLVIVASDSSPYNNYWMEKDRICHLYGSKKTNKISDKEAIVVTPNDVINFWEKEIDRYCKFVFKTSSRDVGLFAVIQKMSFRRNGSLCTDYVQFKESGRRSKKFCGELDDFDPRYGILDGEENNKTIGDDSLPEFKSSRGILETEIFIAKRQISPRIRLNLRIVYTPYQDCRKVNDKSDKYVSNVNNTCILKAFYCDGTRNCAFDNCHDEAGCEVVVNDATGTKVTVGAVTTMLLLFLLFVMCLWTCRKYKKFCWSSDCAGPNLRDDRNQTIDLESTVDQSGRSVVPTAPMLQEETARTVQDKDLPPSYDSLFPEQSVPTTTTTTTIITTTTTA